MSSGLFKIVSSKWFYKLYILNIYVKTQLGIKLQTINPNKPYHISNVHFWTNTFGKGMNSLIPTLLCKNLHVCKNKINR